MGSDPDQVDVIDSDYLIIKRLDAKRPQNPLVG